MKKAVWVHAFRVFGYLLFAALWIVWSAANAQTGGLSIVGGVIDFGSVSGSTKLFKAAASLPGTCAVRELFWRTSDNTVWYCSATNTFTQFGAAGAGASFSAITNGTNTTASMLVGSGASLGATGSGAITATDLVNPNKNIRTIGAILTPTGLTSCIYVPFSGTIQAVLPYGFHAVSLDGATANTVLIKVQTQPTFATFISTGVSGTSDISNGGEQLTSVLGKVDNSLTGWTTALTAGTTVCFVASTFSAGTSVNAEIHVLAN